MSFFDRLIVQSTRVLPRAIVWRFARNYVAGRTLDDGMRVGRALIESGCRVTFDLLGEFITEIEEGRRNAELYLGIVDRIVSEGFENDAGVSIKLTSFGLLLDEEVAYQGARRVIERAARHGLLVRLDMEDSPCTDRTFAFLRRFREEGFGNVGVAIQAYMRRTLDDVEKLQDISPNYRLCKGIYVEPEEIAFKGREEVRDNFKAALRRMFDTGSSVGIATHDEVLIDDALACIEEKQIPRERYEFQMLLGVTENLRQRILDGGHPMRVYVPYGDEWYGYSMRRMKENPRIARYVLMALFRSK